MTWLLTLDMRWLTAACLVLLGLAALLLSLRVWWMSPVQRVGLFGPYLTGEGLRFMLHAWPLVFLFGLYLVAVGASKWAYWQRGRATLETEIANGVGFVEAIFSLWIVGSVVWIAVRTWRGR